MINLNKNTRRHILRRILLMRFLKWSFRIMILFVFLSACRRKMVLLKSPPGFNFSVSEKVKLNLKLREISGIVWDKTRDQFIAEDDESDQVYMLDKDTKNVVGNYSLGEKGDYEDIAVADTIPYILRSDGTIFKFIGDSLKGPAGIAGIEIAKLELQGFSEFESMYYDPGRKALVIICKNCAMDEEDKISAFAYYIDSIGFGHKPIFQIDLQAIKKLAPKKSSKFQPSAAAISPKQQKLYILSALSNQLAIADLNGNVEGVYVLAPSMFPQAEGICFKGNGDMFISNEGGTGRATLLKFTYSENNTVDTSQEKKVGYNFSKPDDKMELGKHLHEISGMSWVRDKNLIQAENDEKGDIFLVDFKNKVDNFQKTKFGGKDDYEDIVHIDTADYLLVSSGIIVQVVIKDSVVTSTTDYKLDIKGNNEFETLYSDAADHSLIMLCKQCAHEKDEIRSAYRFDLKTHQFSADPIYNIDIGVIRQMLKDDKAEFKPSAAAIHPITGQLFVVASVGKLLVITDKKGKVEQVFHLDPDLFNQPEGMTFASNGDLYISNEGGEGVATILKFVYKP
jgi:uncharacterized protein YjiK